MIKTVTNSVFYVFKKYDYYFLQKSLLCVTCDIFDIKDYNTMI